MSSKPRDDEVLTGRQIAKSFGTAPPLGLFALLHRAWQRIRHGV